MSNQKFFLQELHLTLLQHLSLRHSHLNDNTSMTLPHNIPDWFIYTQPIVHTSYITNRYPDLFRFDVDMEGKRAEWEGIVKVPFVDEVGDCHHIHTLSNVLLY